MRAEKRLFAALALASAATSGGLGCNIDAYCFARCDGSSQGGAGVGGAGGAPSSGSFGTTDGTGGKDCGDTMTSLENCGACGKPCKLAGAVPECVAGECRIQSCLMGQYDIDMIEATGCEYACPVANTTAEVCDGIDNDCDSLIDAADPDLVAPTTLCNQKAGTPCAATQVVCDPMTGWTCVYPAGVETESGFIRTVETKCDGIDGNCDGSVDEWFTTLGSSCHDNALGVCTDFGKTVCDPLDTSKTTCDLSVAPPPGTASPEACDGIDNDCNGFVDDDLPDAAFDMVPIPGSAVMMDRYEASRPDSGSAVPGILETVACSKPNVLPWTGGGFAEASAACSARGPLYRLCTASELQVACRGNGDTNYPYGNTYSGMSCNGVDHNTSSAVATGSLPLCASSPTPIYDLSGNVAEWTSTQANAPAPPPGRIFMLAGGSYLSPKLGLACTIPLQPRAVETTLLPSIGFRCCKDP